MNKTGEEINLITAKKTDVDSQSRQRHANKRGGGWKEVCYERKRKITILTSSCFMCI